MPPSNPKLKKVKLSAVTQCSSDFTKVVISKPVQCLTCWFTVRFNLNKVLTTAHLTPISDPKASNCSAI